MNSDETPNMNGHHITTMGIVNALRTGNAQIDMVIALCLPFAINFLITSFKKVYEWALQRGFLASYKVSPKLDHRVITNKTTRDEHGELITDTDDDTHNSALLKAIRLYLHNVVKLRLKDADLDLMLNEDKSAVAREELFDDFECSNKSNTLADTMSKYNVVPSPPKEKYHKLGKFGDSKATIELMIVENQQQENQDENNGNRPRSRRNKTKETMVQYHFRSEDGLAIDDFINKAYQYYLGVLRSNEDNSRYLYELKVTEEENTNHVFKRYRLSEEKTFASLFFREKDSLLTLIDNFLSRSGRYSIPGYPLKLGLLLHGPPGTGEYES